MRYSLLLTTLLSVIAFRTTGQQNIREDAEDSLDVYSPFISFNAANFSLGTAYGIHPNQRNAYPNGYVFIEGDASLSVKSIPLKLTFRASEEPYKSGKPGYFRLSFDAPSYRKGQLQQLRSLLKETNLAIAQCNEGIHLLEGKWSYWNLKKQEWELAHPSVPGIGLPDTSGIALPPAGIPELPGIPDTELPSLSLPDVSMPDVSLPQTPVLTPEAIELQLADINQLLQQQQLQLAKLQKQQEQLQAKYNKLTSWKDLGFTDGIKKVDLGLSTLSPSSLSHNAVPMKGIHISGTVNNYFYDAAAGFTLPNQLFSNQAFDQLINNTNNVFNAGNFFAVNAVRFVSSVVVGYGERDKNAVSVESFYTGKSWQDIRNHDPGTRQLSTNIAFCLTPKRFEQLTWTGAVGHSFSNDTAAATDAGDLSHIAYSSSVTYKLPRLKSQLKGMHRSLGSQYDGWSQGIFLRGATHTELSYKQAFTSSFSATLRGAADSYQSSDTTNTVRKTRQAGLEIQWKLSDHTALVSSYTLLEQKGDVLSVPQQLSHLGKAGLYDHRSFKSWKFHSTLDGGYANLGGTDSSQLLIQLSGGIAAEWRKWLLGIKGTYNRFTGLSRLHGESWCIQPEFGYEGVQFAAKLNYQYLKSEQFGVDNGLVFQLRFEFSKAFSLNFYAQRWLPTEYTFFITDTAVDIKPLYIRGKLTLHLTK